MCFFSIYGLLSCLLIPLLALVVAIDVAIHAQTLAVVGSIRVRTRGCFTGILPTKHMIAVIAHAFCIMWSIRVLAVRDCHQGSLVCWFLCRLLFRSLFLFLFRFILSAWRLVSWRLNYILLALGCARLLGLSILNVNFRLLASFFHRIFQCFWSCLDLWGKLETLLAIRLCWHEITLNVTALAKSLSSHCCGTSRNARLVVIHFNNSSLGEHRLFESVSRFM